MLKAIGAELIKKSAAVMLREMLKRMAGTTAEDKAVDCAKFLIDLSTKETNSALIKEYSLCLASLLFSSSSSSYNGTCSKNNIEGIVKSVLPVLSAALKEAQNFPFIGAVLICLKDTLVAVSCRKELNEALSLLLSLTIEPVDKVINQLSILTKEINAEKLAAVASQILNLVFIVTDWINIILEMVEKSINVNPELIRGLISLP
eukprot:TRINITY_DN4875_c0_g3_i2.p1 TRINITY_DN4875_c0_g3~~TRINITY_DN4875_c0_g3_i2.p1  ORF type:complete len:204 (+),score=37.47 TRINITY_DN4875_c0_g3_i2:221-832(+)